MEQINRQLFCIEQKIMNRASIVYLEPEQKPTFSQRQNTVSTYLKKDVVDSFIAKINRMFRRKGQKSDKKVINHLKWKIKPKIKDMLYSHDLWGNVYYSKVLAKADINQKVFMQNAIIPTRKTMHKPLGSDCVVDLLGVQSPRGKSEHTKLGSELGKFEYQTLKKMELQEMGSKYRSSYNKFMDLVNSNFEEPKTIEEKLARQELLKKCQSYKHLREGRNSAQTVLSVKKQKQNKPPHNANSILQKCDSLSAHSENVKHSLKAFGAFCKKVDQRLEKRHKLLCEKE